MTFVHVIWMVVDGNHIFVKFLISNGHKMLKKYSKLIKNSTWYSHISSLLLYAKHLLNQLIQCFETLVDGNHISTNILSLKQPSRFLNPHGPTYGYTQHILWKILNSNWSHYLDINVVLTSIYTSVPRKGHLFFYCFCS